MPADGRLTRYRKAVLESLRSSNGHPTAAEIYRLVKRRRPGVAYATIYNSLNWLEHTGFIRRVEFVDQAARYDPLVERHDHLVCDRCGALRDVWLKLPAQMLRHAARSEGFRIGRHRTEVFGLCGKCAHANGGTASS
jgi:Fur family transcriptional regulator, peroxide stress response regulator